jgi:hypothetical protein
MASPSRASLVSPSSNRRPFVPPLSLAPVIAAQAREENPELYGAGAAIAVTIADVCIF